MNRVLKSSFICGLILAGILLSETSSASEQISQSVVSPCFECYQVSKEVGSYRPSSFQKGNTRELQISGFLTQAWSLLEPSCNNDTSFNQTLLEILIQAEPIENWSFFTALEWQRQADINFFDPNDPTFRRFTLRVPMLIGWVNWSWKDSFQVTLGRFVTPHGIINIEQFPPVLLENNQPQFLRPFSGDTIFPNYLNGVHFHGTQYLGDKKDSVLLWHAYLANHTNSLPSKYYAGARLSYTFYNSSMTIGGNYAYGMRHFWGEPTRLGNMSVTPIESLTSNHFHMAGADLLIDTRCLLWKTEFFYTWENGYQNRLGFYTQPAWKVSERWIIFYRYDWLVPGQRLTSSLEHVIGVNYLPDPMIRTRFLYFYKEFCDTHDVAHVFQTSITVSF
ncbi:MAG: hypothetical protein VX777_02640 [Chlamydiota bacterium]|nr:hypothetical protein [Chlamydiota bacterium]